VDQRSQRRGARSSVRADIEEPVGATRLGARLEEQRTVDLEEDEEGGVELVGRGSSGVMTTPPEAA
jgi:hypothetical protein